MKPLPNKSLVEVELPSATGVKGKVPSSVSQPNSPELQVKTLFEVQVLKPAPLKLAVKRLDDEAVVEKKLVVVPFTPLKFCRVLEAFTKRLPVVVRPVEVREFRVSRPLALIERAATEEVAPVAVEEVAK